MELWMLFLVLSVARIGSSIAAGSICAVILVKRYGASKEQVYPGAIAAQCVASVVALSLPRVFELRFLSTSLPI